MTAPKTRVRPAFVRFPDRELLTNRRRRFAWVFECDSCGVGYKSRDRAAAKANERAHREWHANTQRVSLSGPV